MPEILKLANNKAIDEWNKLALANSSSITIADNPALYNFYLNALGLKPYYVFLFEKDKPFGLLALVLSGNNMLSMPHFSHGGIIRLSSDELNLTDEELILGTVHMLEKHVKEPGFYKLQIDGLTKGPMDIKYIVEVRQTKPIFDSTKADKVLHKIALQQSSEKQFDTFSSNLRRKINKAAKNGITVKKGADELVDDFASVYNKNMHQLGSPTLGKTFFKSLCQTEHVNAEILVAYYDDKPVGGGFCMWYDGYYENTWFSTLNTYNSFYTSYALHAEMIKSAIDKKMEVYSMGRSTINSGVHQYKLQWPVEEVLLYFNSTKKSGFKLKDQKWLTGIWRILPPIVVNNVGPIIAKRIS